MTLQEELRTLIERSHANFLEQIATVGRLLRQHDADGALSPDGINEAQAITHQLKGTAGSMGFQSVGAAASALDESLKSLKKQSVPVAAQQLLTALDLWTALQRIGDMTTPEMSTLYEVDLSKLTR